MSEAQAFWITDSGHAWLAVPLDSCRNLEISEYSYVDRKAGQAYLEEDCDAGVWITAKGFGRDVVRSWPTDIHNGYCWVRNLPRMKGTK